MTSFAEQASVLAEESAPTTRCRILATAERFFREIGYQKTTVADIAKALRMSPANVYRFFDSKKAINEAVVDRVTREVEALTGSIAVAPGLDAVERLSEIMRALQADCLQRCTENPRIHEMVQAAMSESWDVCIHHVNRIAAVMARVLAEGIARGEFTATDPELAAQCVLASITRFTHPVLVSQYPNFPGPDFEDLIAFVLRGLGARGASKARAG